MADQDQIIGQEAHQLSACVVPGRAQRAVQKVERCTQEYPAENNRRIGVERPGEDNRSLQTRVPARPGSDYCEGYKTKYALVAALVLKAPVIFPWPLNPDSSVIFGWNSWVQRSTFCTARCALPGTTHADS